MKIVRALAATLALGLAACSTLELNTDYTPGTDFSKYKTFEFRPAAEPKNKVAARSVTYAVGMALEAKGLKEVEKGGDLLIYGHFVLDEKMQFDTWGYTTVGWYGYGYGTAATTVRRIPVGTLVLDLVDASSKALVWRGIVKDEISTELYPEEREKKAIGIAKQLFEGYPPGATK
jgi:hypothetical protein